MKENIINTKQIEAIGKYLDNDVFVEYLAEIINKDANELMLKMYSRELELLITLLAKNKLPEALLKAIDIMNIPLDDRYVIDELLTPVMNVYLGVNFLVNLIIQKLKADIAPKKKETVKKTK